LKGVRQFVSDHGPTLPRENAGGRHRSRARAGLIRNVWKIRPARPGVFTAHAHFVPPTITLRRTRPMPATLNDWEGARARLVEARERLKVLAPGHARAEHILKTTTPGDAVPDDRGEPEPEAVTKGVDHFRQMVRQEDGIFRRLAKTDMDAATAKRKFT
jgi:hypothetical protein